MRFSFFALARVAFVTLLLATALAIGLGQMAPATPGWRVTSPAPVLGVNAFFLDPNSRGSIWLSPDGARSAVHLDHGDEVIEYASCSPWSDDKGRRQVIGRWSSGARDGAFSSSFGLFRSSYPDGKVLDHVETEVVPVSGPCWYPGTQARVLFAAGDGDLYQYAFEAEPGGDPVGERAGQPRRIAWECPVPGGGGVYLSDPHWSSDPRAGNLILVGLREVSWAKAEHKRSGPTSIWWLRLSRDGSSIVEAGPLVDSTGDDPRVVERCPTLGRSSDGRLRLAFYRWAPPATSTLQVAEIELAPESGPPRVVGPLETLADDCMASPPIFSTDGRWLTIVLAQGRGRVVRRIPLGDAAEGRSLASRELPQAGRADEASRLVGPPSGAAY